MTIAIRQSEVAVLCACARRHALMPGIGPAASIDWDALIAAADAHGVTDLLLAPLTSSSLTVPARIVQIPREPPARSDGTESEPDDAAGWPVAAIVRPWHSRPDFQGPTLAAGIYGHLASRLSSDLDILVHRRDIARLRPLLIADGYTLPPRTRHRAGSLADGLLPAAGRDDTLMPGQPWQTSVDVHIAFAYWTLGIRLDASALFDRAVTVDVAGHAIATLCPDDLLLVLAIHGMMHGWCIPQVRERHRCRRRARQRLGRCDPRADAARMRRVLRVALLLADELLETTLPAGVAAHAARDPEAVAIAQLAASRMFDAEAANADWDPRPWQLSFMEGPRDRFRFHTRTLIYEWYLKWPWDEWLGRRGAASA